MEGDVPRLGDEHLAKAKEIISRHRTRKTCNRCYNRGYQGIDQNNMAVICYKCVDGEKVTAEWRAYVKDTPALVEAYGDYFEPDEVDESAAAEEKRVAPVVEHHGPKDQRGTRTPQHHRSAGR